VTPSRSTHEPFVRLTLHHRLSTIPTHTCVRSLPLTKSRPSVRMVRKKLCPLCYRRARMASPLGASTAFTPAALVHRKPLLIELLLLTFCPTHSSRLELNPNRIKTSMYETRSAENSQIERHSRTNSASAPVRTRTEHDRSTCQKTGLALTRARAVLAPRLPSPPRPDLGSGPCPRGRPTPA